MSDWYFPRYRRPAPLRPVLWFPTLSPDVLSTAPEGAIILSRADRLAWLGDAVDMGGYVSLSKRGTVMLSYRKRRLTFVDPILWSDTPSPALAGELAALFAACGVGSHPTPAALGFALMRRHYPHGEPVMSRPPWNVWETLHQTLTGGRCELYVSPQERFSEVWEADMNSAYAWAACSVPAGPVAYTRGEPDAGEPAYCRVEARLCGRLSPLAVRHPDGANTYPTSGTVSGWYWREEVERARELGHRVTVREAWVWPRYSQAFAPWASAVYGLRRERPELASYLKRALVAGLGRLAVSPTSQYLCTDDDAEPVSVGSLGPEELLGAKTKTAEREGMLLHVYSHIMASCRLRLLERQLAEREVMATNYDAVYTPQEPSVRPSLDLGAWKVRSLHDVQFPAVRHLLSREKTRLPGVKRV